MFAATTWRLCARCATGRAVTATETGVVPRTAALKPASCVVEKEDEDEDEEEEEDEAGGIGDAVLERGVEGS